MTKNQVTVSGDLILVVQIKMFSSTMKTSPWIVFFLLLSFLFIKNNNDLTVYSEREYDGIVEHTDVRVDGLKFNILHYMFDARLPFYTTPEV